MRIVDERDKILTEFRAALAQYCSDREGGFHLGVDVIILTVTNHLMRCVREHTSVDDFHELLCDMSNAVREMTHTIMSEPGVLAFTIGWLAQIGLLRRIIKGDPFHSMSEEHQQFARDPHDRMMLQFLGKDGKPKSKQDLLQEICDIPQDIERNLTRMIKQKFVAMSEKEGKTTYELTSSGKEFVRLLDSCAGKAFLAHPRF